MKKLFVLAFTTTFSVLYSAYQPTVDHITRGNFSIQHKKFTPADGAWYLIRNLNPSNLESTRSALVALPEDQRVGQFFPISVLVGNRYREVRIPIGRYFNLMLQLKQITTTAEQQAALERLIYSDLPPQPHRNTNLSIIR